MRTSWLLIVYSEIPGSMVGFKKHGNPYDVYIMKGK